MFKGIVCAALLTIALPSFAALGDDIRSARVRPHDARTAALLLQGIERSETIRGLVSRLEADSVIVYVEMQPALHHDLAGRLVWLAATADYRYVRISLNPELSSEVLISVLGHELQHALEVARAPSIVDEDSLAAYYKKYGMSMRQHNNGWDTQAARDAGDLVRREIANSSTRTAAELSQPFTAASWHTVYRDARDRFTSR